MFDEIKKTIPEVDENDYQKIYHNVISKKEIKKNKTKKNISLFTMAICLILLVLFISIPLNTYIKNDINETPKGDSYVEGDNGIENNNPEKGDNASNGLKENSYNNNKSIELLGIAAYKEFDNYKKTSFKKLENDTDLQVSYPFQYVKIKSAYKFTINIDDINDKLAKSIIENSCGLGEVEVVIADFITYTKEGNSLIENIEDTLISLRGYNGYYTILSNSQINKDGETITIFSSHKQLTNNEVIKDFTPPVLSIFLKEYSDNKYIYFKSSDNLLTFNSYNQEYAIKNEGNIEKVDNDTLYSVLDVIKVPTIQINVTIKDIDKEKRILEVISNQNLQYVIVNENINISQFEIGQIIIVEYDMLFDSYNPFSVTANKITIYEGDKL